MSDVSMQPNVQTATPKYTPEDAAKIRNEIAQNLQEQAKQKGITPPMTISFAPEISGDTQKLTPFTNPNGLERSPEQDGFELQDTVLGASNGNVKQLISPKGAVEGISTMTAILVGLKELVNAGFDLNDLFKDRMGKNDEQNTNTPKSTNIPPESFAPKPFKATV